jgi:hypothetical protein
MPSHTFFYFLDTICLAKHLHHIGIFPYPYCTLCDQKRWISNICWDALLYLQHLKATGTGRQELKWVHEAGNIPAIWIDRYINKQYSLNMCNTPCSFSERWSANVQLLSWKLTKLYFVNVIPVCPTYSLLNINLCLSKENVNREHLNQSQMFL